jgi:hypothetical protein
LGVRIITPSMTACPPTIKSLSLVLTDFPSCWEKRVDRATPTLPCGFGHAASAYYARKRDRPIREASALDFSTGLMLWRVFMSSLHKSFQSLKSNVLLLGRSNLCGRIRLSLLAIPLVKAINATGRIHQFLLASEKRVALRADFHVKLVLARRARREYVAARTLYPDFVVVRVNYLFHLLYLL